VLSVGISRIFCIYEARVSSVADVTIRNRWEQFKYDLHFIVTTKLYHDDKLCKIKTILQPLVENFTKNPVDGSVCRPKGVILKG
jgi:hypothetical protein